MGNTYQQDPFSKCNTSMWKISFARPSLIDLLFYSLLVRVFMLCSGNIELILNEIDAHFMLL